jgi:NosR/NirI family nitrous oxide reductase transcriptional regulator
MRALLGLVFLILSTVGAGAAPLTRDEVAALVMPPFAVGVAVNDRGVWQLLNSGGAEAGHVFETEPLAPFPGFSGAPINLLVTLDLEGRFLDVHLISQSEPIFVSGLGEAPLRKFLEQYRGHSILAPLVVGNPYGSAGAGTDLVYLDGVTKATASVQIAHQSILAAALTVVREKMAGVATHPPAYPNPGHDEALTWADLVAQGLASHLQVSNRALDAAFAGTVWADDDPVASADPDGLYLDAWVVDLGPPAVARAVLDADGLASLQRFQAVSGSDEPILVIDAGRHGLVSEDFVRNTAPDRLSGLQGGLPLALRDADLDFATRPEVPQGSAMILRIDRRLGFDPTQDWTLRLQAVRRHGMFMPETGSAHFSLTTRSAERFFLRPGVVDTLPAWREAIRNRWTDLGVLAVFLGGLLAALGLRMHWLAGLGSFTTLRLAVLGFVLGFVGWWGQGQLSIVTVLGAIRTGMTGGSYAYLLYDPFSLLVWGATGLGFFLWGRGLFCGWLCPFGALQEFAHHLGRLLRLPQVDPTPLWDRRLKAVKYVLLAGMVATAVVAPDRIDTIAEVEPFKTAITVFFLRSWPFAAYALAWVVLGMFTFKGFCRYVCPLGAVMAMGGLVRGRDWIDRRAECGSPCQLCKVRCRYGAIRANGNIVYSECFQCLDCVTIHDDPETCVPLVLAARRQKAMGVS